MNSYEYLLKTAEGAPAAAPESVASTPPTGLPAPLRRDPNYDDIVEWDTPGGHTIRHLYDPKRLAERGEELKAQLAAVNSNLDAEGKSVAKFRRTTKRFGNALLGGVTGAGLGLLGGTAVGHHTPIPAVLGGLAGALYGGTRHVPLPKVRLQEDYTDPYALAEEGRAPVSALYGVTARDRAEAEHRARVQAELEDLRDMRDSGDDWDAWDAAGDPWASRRERDPWRDAWRDRQRERERENFWRGNRARSVYNSQKYSSEDVGYSTAAPTSTTPRRTGIGAPALPPAPSAAPTTMAPAPSPKLGGLMDDIETTLRRRRLAQLAQGMAAPGAEAFTQNYRNSRNKTLTTLGLGGLGVGLGGLALYGAGRYALNRAKPAQPDEAVPALEASSEAAPPLKAEDYAPSYG